MPNTLMIGVPTSQVAEWWGEWILPPKLKNYIDNRICNIKSLHKMTKMTHRWFIVLNLLLVVYLVVANLVQLGSSVRC